MNRDLKIAILEKVTNILDGIDRPESFSIDIYYNADEVTSITYRAKEWLVPKDAHTIIEADKE